MKKKQKKGKNESKISRRRFIGTGIRTTGYGVVGGLFGKAYQVITEIPGYVERKIGNLLYETDETPEKITQAGRSIYEKGERDYKQGSEIKGYARKATGKVVEGAGEAAKGMSKIESWRLRLFRSLLGRTDEDARKWREKKRIGEYQDNEKTNEKTNETKKPKTQEQERRGFLRYLLGKAHNHPVETGAAIGALAGLGSSVSRYQGKQGRNEKDLAILKDRSDEQNKAILRLKSRKNETLEDKTQPKIILILAGIGLLISIFLSVSKITGFVIGLNETSLEISSLIVFLVSFIMIIISKII